MIRLILAAALAFGTSSAVQAEVTKATDYGFTVQHETEIAAPPEEVWKTLIAPSRWWNGDHSWSANADNLYLVAQAGGCFCELLRTTGDDNIKSSEGSVQHMRVLFALKNKMLRMSGALGPLQGEAVTGTLTIQFKPTDDKTAVRFTYKVGGYMDYPVDQIAPAVDGVITEQLDRLTAIFAPEEAPQAADEEGDGEAEAEAPEETDPDS